MGARQHRLEGEGHLHIASMKASAQPTGSPKPGRLLEFPQFGAESPELHCFYLWILVVGCR